LAESADRRRSSRSHSTWSMAPSSTALFHAAARGGAALGRAVYRESHRWRRRGAAL